MVALSKSKLLALRQCPKRLWLELYRPTLREDSAATLTAFKGGDAVGAVARQLYDPVGVGHTLDLQKLGMKGLLAETRQLLALRQPIFEAGFATQNGTADALALADVLLPLEDGLSWHMIEVKSSTQVKDYHLEDAAIQFHVAQNCGMNIDNVSLAVVDSGWTYLSEGDYRGLLVETDVTAQVAALGEDVRDWIQRGHEIRQQEAPPELEMGKHCQTPFPCGFTNHCSQEDAKRKGHVEHPISWLPKLKAQAVLDYVETRGARDMSEVPDKLLNPIQQRVKSHTLQWTRFFDAQAAADALRPHTLPAFFLDFETIAYVVPIWLGTRPYQQIPFQFSLHRLDPDGKLAHHEFLDLSGDDPRESFAKALVNACDELGPVYAYNASFEATRLRELAQVMPALENRLMDVESRLVDLLPIFRNHYYHPDQHGSWSLKKVLPSIAPELSYEHLEGVQDGTGAQTAYLECVQGDTESSRREMLRTQLLTYCQRDTFALVRLWQYLSSNVST